MNSFSANAAHEMRTPVPILTARLDHPEENGFLNDLKRDARKIRAIVDQLLASAWLDRCGGGSAAKLDLSNLLQSVVHDRVLLALKEVVNLHSKQMEIDSQQQAIAKP
ncbi:MAG: hypothetical protein FJX45_17180 [Alphaproteobacteria bacterium]|nr:hypothetical protein [Alphaproteobacteria bacterium]